LNRDLLKSQGDLAVALYLEMFADLVAKYPEESKSLNRDADELKSRYANEGLSFLTKTLPKLGKALDEAMETQMLCAPKCFKKAHKSRTIPAFLQGLFSKCFDTEGCLAVDCPPEVIKDLRQVCFLCYKLELPYSKCLESQVIENFVDTEVELQNAGWSEDYDTDFFRVAKDLVAEVLHGVNLKDIKPKHGPGAVATGEKLDDKWLFKRHYRKLHESYPYYEYFVAGWGSELEDRKDWYFGLERLATGTAKVVLVPKDSRGPRLISCEPLEYQYIQQGINRVLVDRLESHRLTKGQINFQNQEVNRNLALTSSQTREFATLDLKDASDRVTRRLVEELFPKEVFRYLDAARTTATILPDGRVFELCKFAPMGSAICFSVEALVFWALSVAAVVKATGYSSSAAARSVFVYGDDIIVPRALMQTVSTALEYYHLKVNRLKCFSQGYFRESCGMDAFQGVDVTPTRIKTVWTGRPSDASVYVSYVSYANRFYAMGYKNTARYMRTLVERTYGKVPYGLVNSGYPNWNVDTYEDVLRLNKALGFRTRYRIEYQTTEIKAAYLKPRKAATTLSGWLRLLRNITAGPGDVPDEVTHPRSVQIKRGWRRI